MGTVRRNHWQNRDQRECINCIVLIKSAWFLLCREVRRLWPENGEQQVSRDFVLMTSFPQRRITDMENSLASAGELK